MNLFDFIKTIFGNPKIYNSLKPYEKAKHFFMTNRFMSIRYPVQANMFNNIHIEPDRALDYWQKSLNGTRTWYFPKTKKAGTKKSTIPSEEAISFYLEKKKYSREQLETAVKILGPSTYDPIFQIEELLSNK